MRYTAIIFQKFNIVWIFSKYVSVSQALKKTLFWRTFANDCFYTFLITLIIIFTLTIIRTRRLQMFYKIGVLKNFANFTGKHLCWSVLLIKFLTNSIKDTPTQVVSCEIWKIFKNTSSTEHLQWLLLSKETPTQVFAWEIWEFFKNNFFYRLPPVAASECTLLSSKIV